MNSFKRALLRACVLASVPIVTFAQAPVIVEAESGSLGANLTTGTDAAAGVNYITVLPAANSAVAPTPDRVATWSVTFPAAGNYALYVRILTGPVGGADDSFYIPSGFNVTNNWPGLYNTSSGGATAPNQGVPTGGGAGQNVWKWVRMTALPGATGSVGPAQWVVPDGALTQNFSWGSREDGLLFDKFAFGPINACYTVGDLDAVRAPSISCPTPPAADPPPYTRTGQPLATGQAKFLGSAHSPPPADPNATNPARNFSAYWNQVTPENGGKWGSAQPQSPFGPADQGYPLLATPQFNFGAAHSAEAQAVSQGVLFKWHTLFWGNQQPGWIESLPVAKQEEAIRIWLAAIARDFPNLQMIEVVNEPLHDPPRGATNGNYIEALGGDNGLYGTGWDWIIRSFELAREYFPNAKLVLNDYSITNDGNATTRYLQIIDLLKARGLIDVVGIQAHAFEFNYNNLAQSAATHTANLARLKTAGLPVIVTELDIDGVDPTWGLQDDAVQLERFRAIFPVFWENDAVTGVTMWGYMRGSHWRTAQGAWLMYPNGAERPALQWLVRYMENKVPVIAPGQAFTVAENTASGSAIGTVTASDGDSDPLSQWQITDGSGKFAIDPASGAISLAAGATLDFEMATSYSVSVSVYDGYRRSVPEAVTINVTNLNDNAPVITAGQSYRIDGGSHNTVAKVLATDADDTNQPGFTTFSGWTITSGNTNTVFRFSGPGNLQVGRPLLIDWRKTSYNLGTQVSDGANPSAVQAVQVTIPNRVNLCLLNVIKLEAPKATAPLLILLGSELGSCNRPL
jgi:endo-1,4-beta-xylanase